MLQPIAEKTVDFVYRCIPRPVPSKETLRNTRIISHRGAHNNKMGIIENTDQAFKRAQDIGCWGIELDVQVTADNKIVVNHDPDLKRLWGQKLAIKDLNYNELHQLAPDIPLLSEVVETYGTFMHLFIELKAPFNEETQLTKTLSQLKPCEDYHLITLDEKVFQPFKQFPKEALLLVATFNKTKKYCQLCIEKDYGGVLGHYVLLNHRLVQQLNAADKKTGVGFVDSRYSLYREAKRNLDWLFTNNVEQLFKYHDF